MPQQHTAEPWRHHRPDHPGYPGDRHTIDAQNRTLLCVPVAGNRKEAAEFDANAERAVLCVNACAGIPTDVLEQLVKESQTPAARLAWLSLEAESAMRRDEKEGH